MLISPPHSRTICRELKSPQLPVDTRPSLTLKAGSKTWASSSDEIPRPPFWKTISTDPRSRRVLIFTVPVAPEPSIAFCRRLENTALICCGRIESAGRVCKSNSTAVGAWVADFSSSVTSLQEGIQVSGKRFVAIQVCDALHAQDNLVQTLHRLQGGSTQLSVDGFQLRQLVS